eukprot:GHVT01062425.1.p1 GENE.GHVT01062425.1~~GHVT01062425.1.p1  ORF type:complete len:195 (+),score=29.82 GHVT01062425.1:2004-2588(+)
MMKRRKSGAKAMNSPTLVGFHLQLLDLSWNFLKADKASTVAKFLIPTKLHTLNLDHNPLGDSEGTVELFLHAVHTLQVSALTMNSCNLGSVFATKLTARLEAKTTGTTACISNFEMQMNPTEPQLLASMIESLTKAYPSLEQVSVFGSMSIEDVGLFSKGQLPGCVDFSDHFQWRPQFGWITTEIEKRPQKDNK